MTLPTASIPELARRLAMGETRSRTLVEAALEAIDADPRAFVFVDAAGARAAADAADGARIHGHGGGHSSQLAGLPVSVKDLFDVAGQATRAGTTILESAAPAGADAPPVARLRAAGAIIIGRTQMSEFAFTGLGLNPHSPQPPNPADGARVPGGSSGGAAVSVGLGQAVAGLGSDTGGSVRIPAAFCGLAGFKPTQSRISRQGAYPLAPSLDSVGAITRTIACCRIVDSVIADQLSPEPAKPVGLAGLRLAIPEGYLLEGLDPEVAAAFERAVGKLSVAGVRVSTLAFPELAAIPAMNARGSISNAEAYAFHRRSGLLEHRSRYDPIVLARIEMGAQLSAADYLDLLAARGALIAAAEARTREYDALIWPTAPILAPKVAAVSEAAEFNRLNGLALRNASVVNLLDRCAATVPMASDVAPAGLMIVGPRSSDAATLTLAEAVEPVVA